MRSFLDDHQIQSYRENGFLLVENFLDAEELNDWRTAVNEAMTVRGGRKMPNNDTRVGEDDGINKDSEYYGKVFDQILNLWQTDDHVKRIMFDKKIGKMVADLAGWSGTRIWHDQALVKRPWANPTSWHLDTPFWSFSDRRALSIWVALDDATSCSFHNGLTIHGAGANMTSGFRRAMTCAYMPDGAEFNGIKNILSNEQIAKLKVGDLLNDDTQNPIIYSSNLS